MAWIGASGAVFRDAAEVIEPGLRARLFFNFFFNFFKMLDLEALGVKFLDSYQNFAKAFKVRDFQAFMASRKANNARLKSAAEFGRAEMGESSELHQSILRAVL